MERYKNFNRFLQRKVQSVHPAYCQGFLYHLPIGFPGLITLEDCQDLVVGELMSFKNPVKIMRALDHLEGYHPDDHKKSLYIRRKLPVIVEVDAEKHEFEELEAWVYTYPLDHLTPAHLKEFFISCGNWKLLCEQPTIKEPRRISALFKKMHSTPEPGQIHIDPALCMDEEMHSKWSKTTACSKFCKNPDQCRSNRRKVWSSFTLT